MGEVAPALPIALLESMRAHDRPDEVLEDEDLTASLPRRLGLTGVIDTQIRRYQGSDRPVAMEEFVSLVRLVLKRPDAAAILRRTGESMARRQFERLPTTYVRLLRALPRVVLLKSWKRSVRRMLKDMVGDAIVETVKKPLTVRVTGSELVHLEPPGSACVLYEGALDELLALYAGSRGTVYPARCAATGGPTCEWNVHFEEPGSSQER